MAIIHFSSFRLSSCYPCNILVPFNTILVSNVNLRICSAIGCFFAVGGVLSSAWASQLWHLLVGLSLCGGKYLTGYQRFLMIGFMINSDSTAHVQFSTFQNSVLINNRQGGKFGQVAPKVSFYQGFHSS